MLSRVLEPEVMDDPSEALAYDTMDHSAVNEQFVVDLLAAADELRQAVDDDNPKWIGIVDVGTGTAQIPIALCRRAPIARVMAVDAAASMLNLARMNVELANLTQRITLRQLDAKQQMFDEAMFDVAMSNSIVHHIAEPLSVLAEMVRVTRPGGLIFVRDLMRPSSVEELAGLVETYAGNADATQRALFAESLRAALTVDEVQRLIAQLGFEPAHVRRASDRHWTWSTRKDS